MSSIINESIDFKAVFGGSAAGDRVLQRIRQFCHMDESTISVDDRGALDVHNTLIRDGERNVGLFIMSRVKLDVETIKNRQETADNEETQDSN